MSKQHHNESDQMPDGAKSALQRLYTPSPSSDADSERFLHDLAEQRLCRRSFVSHLNRKFAVAASVGLVLVGGLLMITWSSQNQSTGVQTAASRAALVGDIDANGIVDVRDAFTVARAIDRGDPTNTKWDIVPDGAVDQQDVEFILSLAVTLPALVERGEGG